jgi:hypothetical protein
MPLSFLYIMLLLTLYDCTPKPDLLAIVTHDKDAADIGELMSKEAYQDRPLRAQRSPE